MPKQRFILLLILFAALSRLIPHPPNFTAVGAIALFAGAKLTDQRLAFIIPIAALWLSDLLINNTIYASYYNGFVFLTEGFGYIAAGMILIVIIGQLMLRRMTVKRLLFGTVLASLSFFLITNFGVWSGTHSPYPANFQGLMLCYEAAIPFFRNEFAGTLLYSGVLFGLFEVAMRHRILPVRPGPPKQKSSQLK